MDKRNVVISKKSRGIGFVLVNGKVVTVRSGKPVGAAILPDSITSRHKDLQFTGAKQSATKMEQGVSAAPPKEAHAPPINKVPERKEEKAATPTPSLPPIVPERKPKKASPQPLDVEQLGELAISKKAKEETKYYPKGSKGKKGRYEKARVVEKEPPISESSEPEL